MFEYQRNFEENGLWRQIILLINPLLTIQSCKLIVHTPLWEIYSRHNIKYTVNGIYQEIVRPKMKIDWMTYRLAMVTFSGESSVITFYQWSARFIGPIKKGGVTYEIKLSLSYAGPLIKLPDNRKLLLANECASSFMSL